MREFITDRTQADVDRCKVLAAKGWNNMDEAERAEWYDAAMRGAYNYSDLNRVESAVAELSEFLGLGLTTKTNWGVWDAPTQRNMGRYISNLHTIKERYAPSATIPDAMNGLTYESANNIERMLSEACVSMESSDVWEKYHAKVKYSWVYTRDDSHESVGTTGTDTIAGQYTEVGTAPDGLPVVSKTLPANSTINFSADKGFYLNPDDYTSLEKYYIGRYIGLETQCRQVTAFLGEKNGMYEYEYKVVGYATKEWTPDCTKLTYCGKFHFLKGELPSGTLLEGSYDDGYCYMLDADGSYYYYELR